MKAIIICLLLFWTFSIGSFSISPQKNLSSAIEQSGATESWAAEGEEEVLRWCGVGCDCNDCGPKGFWTCIVVVAHN